ncbi:hypothetical protein DVH24_024751 [Malus domestica]|uniref:Transmembrane protein n=1 Tax=Malus domestica TaxID=3750 RepID=A0A498JJJ5_MALDO|nr:hypothetical protein DVH24_024751 [Malus domestica]
MWSNNVVTSKFDSEGVDTIVKFFAFEIKKKQTCETCFIRLVPKGFAFDYNLGKLSIVGKFNNSLGYACVSEKDYKNDMKRETRKPKERWRVSAKGQGILLRTSDCRLFMAICMSWQCMIITENVNVLSLQLHCSWFRKMKMIHGTQSMQLSSKKRYCGSSRGRNPNNLLIWVQGRRKGPPLKPKTGGWAKHHDYFVVKATISPDPILNSNDYIVMVMYILPVGFLLRDVFSKFWAFVVVVSFLKLGSKASWKCTKRYFLNDQHSRENAPQLVFNVLFFTVKWRFCPPGPRVSHPCAIRFDLLLLFLAWHASIVTAVSVSIMVWVLMRHGIGFESFDLMREIRVREKQERRK